MVNIDIPNDYTVSPSSATPHLTINRDVTIDLDSTNAFEGPEKLLEVWFSPSASSLPEGAKPYGLKAVSSDTWKEMLDLVNCKVLSVIGHGHMDAYLLSESSMFVFPHKLVLKTCGTTTLLYGLPRMLEIAALEAGFPGVKANLSAANFLYPDQQRGPHRSWRDEVKFLDQRFLGGSAYMIGKMNGEHWYLYITGPNTQLTPPATPERETFTKVLDYPEQLAADMANAQIDESQDETLEVLMTDLDEQNARQFYLEDASAIAEGKYLQQSQEARKDAISHLGNINGDDDVDVFAQTTSDPSEKLTFPEELTTEGHTLGSVVSEACGLADVYPVSKYPEAKIDSYLFTPCGFSANGVVPSTGESASAAHYFTVHTGRETRDIVVQVVNIFKPGRFSVTVFEAKTDEDGYGRARVKKDKNMDNIAGYRRVDRIVHDLEGYELVFRYFERLDWKGGAPRLGEYML
ncbi:unnamed protein product [Aureobasidium uvarum]|uniref:Adenosylmethionine decarboxylase n=1 Tax=Aureobasidium uvarum TaxID=2773716 RepID=A0A9N8KHQ3_9PEZI|nr:unnamed protein product [Aureobasidium uvarum]